MRTGCGRSCGQTPNHVVMMMGGNMVVAVVAALVCVVAAGLEPAPSFPTEDPSLVANDAVVTRARNSEVVDLGHPGPFGGNDQREDCPEAASDVVSWHDEATWPNGAPSGGDVEVPAGKRVVVSRTLGAHDFGTITIPATSELIFADGVEIAVTAHGFQVFGALRAGSATCKRRSALTVTLTGSRPSDPSKEPFHAKGIDVLDGTLELHGVEYYHTWSRLAVTAKAGDSTVFLQDGANWDVGSLVVVVSTQLKDSRDWHQNEQRVVTSVRAASHLGENVTAVSFADPLEFGHYGGPEYQAEVGLLSRRLKIQGDINSEPTDIEPVACSNDAFSSYPCEDSSLTGYGGHVVVRGQNSIARISGVEFYRMGQTNVKGRYPFHWHLLGDTLDGDHYIVASSIHRSFYKCVTIHGTNGVRVSRNVAFDAIGHCLYLEDGVEERNVIEYNLHAHVHVIGVPPGGSSSQSLPTVFESESLATAADATASGFYLSNAWNFVRGNAAVGGFSGFQFPIMHTPVGYFRQFDDVSPYSKPTLLFDGNSCHSSGWWWGHGACVYAGGVLEHAEKDGLDPDGPTLYKPGRDTKGHATCVVDVSGYSGRCPEWQASSECTGEYPVGCRASHVLTNFKAALTRSALMHWGQRVRVSKLEVHDFTVGPAVEVFGEASVDQMLATFRTDNVLVPPCDRACNQWDLRFQNWRHNALTWYDTHTTTLVTNSTFRACDPTAWTGCRYGCLESVVYQFTAHSDQFLPEWLSVTAAIRYDGPVRTLIGYNVDGATVSKRTMSWYDYDGTACDRGWGPTIIGSNVDAGDWWRIDERCEAVSDGLAYCCPAGDKLPASFTMRWDDAVHDLVGSSICDNSFRDNGVDCPVVGWLARFGGGFNTPPPNGGGEEHAAPLKITANSEVVGVADAGWYLWLENGAPRTLRLNNVQVRASSTLVLAVSYPLGTQFNVRSEAVPWCRSDCELEYTQVQSFNEVEFGDGDTYFVDQGDDSSTLYLRVVQRNDRNLAPEVSSFSNEWFEAHDPDFGVPRRKWNPTIYVEADCPGDVYCDSVEADVPSFDVGGASTLDCDSGTWHKADSPSKDCAWVADFSPARCAVKGAGNEWAYASCRSACGACDRGACAGDSPTWFLGDETDNGCAWVAEAAGIRCHKRAADGVYAFQACPEACGLCEPLCDDSAEWHVPADPSKDCTWVSLAKGIRCARYGADGDPAFLACQAACSSCTLDCIDNPAWYKKDTPSKTCAWVAEKPDSRCIAKGHDDDWAFEHCPSACGTCLEASS